MASVCQVGHAAPTKGTIHDAGYDNRAGFGQAGFPGAWGRRRRGGGVAPPAQAPADGAVFHQTAELFDWPGGVRHGASLGPHAAGSRPRGAADPTGLRQSLCAPEQDRPGRRRGYLRGGEPAVDALCPNQEPSRPGDGGGASGARAADRAAHSDDQHAARADGRVRGGCRQGPAACQGTGGRAGRAGERARTAAPGFVGAGPNS